MKIHATLILIAFSVAFSQPFGWERVYPEITGKVSEIKYLSDDDPHSVIFALQEEGIGYYKDSVLIKFSYNELPVISVEFVDSLADNILCAIGNGSENDGLYKFNKEAETFSLLLSSESPNFIQRMYNGRYYLGSKDGLFFSEDCISWQSMDSLIGKNIIGVSYVWEGIFAAVDSDKLYYFENDTLTIVDPELQITDIYGGFITLKGGSYSDGVYYAGKELYLYCYVHNPDILGSFFSVGRLVISLTDDKFYYIDSHHAPILSDLPSCQFEYDTIYCTQVNHSSALLDNFFIGTDTGVYLYLDAVGIDEGGNEIKDFEISQNYPNPFNNETKIQLSLEKSSYIELDIFNSRGELVRNLVSNKLNKGSHNFKFKADYLNSGLYYYRLSANGTVQAAKKMLYLK